MQSDMFNEETSPTIAGRRWGRAAVSLAAALLLMTSASVGLAQLGGAGAPAPGEDEQNKTAPAQQGTPARAGEKPDEDEPVEADHGQRRAEEVDEDAPAQAKPAAAARTSAAAQERSIPGGTLVVAAYAVLWLLIFGFVFVIMRRQRALDIELEGLEQRMDEVLDEWDEAR